MNRRTLLAGVPFIAVIPMIGCKSLTSSQLELDAEAVANAVASMAITLESVIPEGNTALFQEIQDAALTAGKDATALGALVSPANTADLIAALVGVVTTYDGLIVTYLPQSAAIITVLNAALVLAQGLYADANLPSPVMMVGSKVGIRPKLGVPVMPLDLARATLAHVHQRGADLR